MTKSDIQKIEKILQKRLPPFYQKTMLNYPFPKDSFADEFLLWNDPDFLIKSNSLDSVFDQTDDKFAIGSDGGEEIYYIKISNFNNDRVYVYDFEDRTGKEMIKSSSWGDYLKDIQVTLDKLAEDDKRMEEEKRNKKWWQFWI